MYVILVYWIIFRKLFYKESYYIFIITYQVIYPLNNPNVHTTWGTIQHQKIPC